MTKLSERMREQAHRVFNNNDYTNPMLVTWADEVDALEGKLERMTDIANKEHARSASIAMHNGKLEARCARLEAELKSANNIINQTPSMHIARELAQCEARCARLEKALYNAIEEGVAHAFLDIDHDTKRARVLTQEEVVAKQEEPDGP